MKIPFVCPVCSGTSQVPNGFYNQINGGYGGSTTDITPETCRSCDRGIVWGSDEDVPIKMKFFYNDEFPHISSVSCQTCEHYISETINCGKECVGFNKWKSKEPKEPK